jgi:ABC-type Mn2+/Zn2+ transport system permease subunit
MRYGQGAGLLSSATFDLPAGPAVVTAMVLASFLGLAVLKARGSHR